MYIRTFPLALPAMTWLRSFNGLSTGGIPAMLQSAQKLFADFELEVFLRSLGRARLVYLTSSPEVLPLA